MADNYTIVTVDITDEDEQLVRVEFHVYDSNNRLLKIFNNRADANDYVQSLIEQEQEYKPSSPGM
jgi:hypothetical protein